MIWTTDKLRKEYLEFFKAKGHQVFASDSLIPEGDASLLFTGAGMNQFKPYFLGLKKDVKRATSCQKCMRTADLERVGKTAYHHTFFEMLGNFSFGDYFKEEAIAYGWEFVTGALKIPRDKLWVSVYEDDDEAFEIWKKKIGLPESVIVRMDAVDNFWPSNAKVDGPNGPCGPCSEIYVGPTPGKGVEIWNLVFTQFDRQSDGSLKNLPQRNIDTGMGLERAASVLQGVESNYDIDTFKKIRAGLKTLLKNGSHETAHENAVMDHARAVIFSIADGGLPSNDGRGYVVRKLIRLASDHMAKAGAVKPGTLSKVAPFIVEVVKDVYPEVAQREKTIMSILENEEKAYLDALATYGPKLSEEWKRAGNPSEVAFKYYDTFGLPFEIIEESAASAGVKINKAAFDELLAGQKQRSRQSSKIAGEIFSKTDVYSHVEGLPPTRFLGYETLESESKLLRILKNNKSESVLSAGEEGLLIFEETPFYAESGGQVGDDGTVFSKNAQAAILDTQAIEKCFIHKTKVSSGELRVGEKYSLRVDTARRAAIMKNHTATHLLHSALRKVLGDHVKQSGSLVAADRLRFDFTHFSAVHAEAVSKIEELVNAEIQKNISLEKRQMDKDTAVREGAIAFFGEKYGDSVRVVSIGEFSKELCGGTHLKSTGEIGIFKILSEGSIQAGVRRIEAVTGDRALEFLRENENELEAVAKQFGVRKESLSAELKKLSEKVQSSKSKVFQVLNEKLKKHTEEKLKNSPETGGVKLLVENINGADTDLFKNATEHLKTLGTPFVALFSSESDDKLSFVVAASADVVKKGFQSGKIVKEVAAKVQGNGGGRPDFAVGGGKDVSKKEEALRFGEMEIKKQLGVN